MVKYWYNGLVLLVELLAYKFWTRGIFVNSKLPNPMLDF